MALQLKNYYMKVLYIYKQYEGMKDIKSFE